MLLLMIAAEPVPVETTPLYLYTMAAVAVLVAIATAAPKVVGPFAKMWEQFVQSKRRTAVEVKKDALMDRDIRISYLEGVNAERLRELQARDELIAQHVKWDWEMYNKGLKAGCDDIGVPPPLLPDIPLSEVISKRQESDNKENEDG